MNTPYLQEAIAHFLREDLVSIGVDNRDDRRVRAKIEAQEVGVMSCGEVALDILDALTPPRCRNRPTATRTLADGNAFSAGATLVAFEAHPETVRCGIRTALNLLMHTCGVARRTRELQMRVAHFGCRLLDTRKTLPGLRAFEKRAVLDGGAANHRHGRYDGVMLKREDVILDGGIVAAISRASRVTPHLTGIEVEVDSIAELEQVLADGRVRHALLDNMSPELVSECVVLVGDRVSLEASGISVDDLEKYAATGVPFISTSALIFGAPPCKMHLVML